MSQYLIFKDFGDSAFNVDDKDVGLEAHLHEVWMYGGTPDHVDESDDLAEALDKARALAARDGRRVVVMDTVKFTDAAWRPAVVYDIPATSGPRTVEFRVKLNLTATDEELITDGRAIAGEAGIVDTVAEALAELILNAPGDEGPDTFGIEIADYSIVGEG